MTIKKSEIRQMPKIDLHRHLDGDVNAKTIFNLARINKTPLPADNSRDLAAYFKNLKNTGLANLFRDGFGLVTSLMQTPENLATVAYEEVRNLFKDNIIYAEIQFAPQYHTGESVYYNHGKRSRKNSYEEIIKSVWLGLKQGERDFGVKTNIIVDIGREATSEIGIEVAKAAIKCIRYNVVALGLATDEADFPPERHKQAFQLTFDTELRRSVHAGEFGNQLHKNILTSINDLKADRLGHARIVSQHEDLLQKIKENNVGIESCPESNIFTNLIKSRHEIGIKKLLEEDVRISINSDDPAMFGYTLTDTIYRLCKEEAWLDAKGIRKLQINAALSSFLKQEEKKALVGWINREYNIDGSWNEQTD
ncbi:MAG: adenosine deaminase [Candidatus Marsarchaeota archaeon]|nr:adenosine deaminase [Candidatus Marsarchaeota archaeon]